MTMSKANQSVVPALLLAAVVALEVCGVQALARVPGDGNTAIAIDGGTFEMPAPRVASVEIRVVAQANLRD